MVKEFTPPKKVGFETHLVGGFNPLRKYAVKLDHFPKVPGQNSKKT